MRVLFGRKAIGCQVCINCEVQSQQGVRSDDYCATGRFWQLLLAGLLEIEILTALLGLQHFHYMIGAGHIVGSQTDQAGNDDLLVRFPRRE
jgi:hypothetical protein